MARVKTRKNASAVDMTAMCDVAFLLLTFFILTATAKQPEPLAVDTPVSSVQTKLPDTDLATITIGHGKVFFGVVGGDVRVRTLELMGENTKLTKCVLGLNQCSDTAPCPMHSRYKFIKKQLTDLFDKENIEQLAKDVDSGASWIHNQ